MAFFATQVGERGVGLYLQRTRAKYSLRFAKIRAKSELRLKRPIIGSQKGFQGSPKSISSKAPTIPLYTLYILTCTFVAFKAFGSETSLKHIRLNMQPALEMEAG